MTTTQQPITKFAIFIVLLGTFFYCYEFFIQVAPAVMTSELMHDFKINATLLGTMSGFFYYSYTFFQIPAGLLLDRYGARIILTFATLICALGALVFSQATSVSAGSLARLLMGTGSAFAFVSVLYLIIHWIPARRLALFIGLTQAMSSVGAIAGQAPLATLIHHISWRTAMFGFFLVGFVIAIIIALFVRNKPNNETIYPPKKINVFKTLHIVLSKTQTWYIAIYSFAIWAPMTAFASLWGVPFLKTNMHMNDITAAKAIAFIWIGVAIGSPLLGWFSDHIKRRCLPLTFAAVTGLMALLTLLYAPHLNHVTVDLLLFCIGLSASGQSLVFAVIRDINPIHVSGAANGFNNMIIVISGAILQPLIGKLLDFSWNGAMIHGVRVYQAANYQTALLVLPIGLGVATLLSLFAIRETRCVLEYTI